MSNPNLVDLAIISNVPTPYRLHVLRRVARELPGVRLHSLFTHKDSGAGMPWNMQADADINPVTFGENALNPGETISPRTARLFKQVRQYIVQHNVRLIILLGYNDRVRMRLIRWAKRNRIPLLLTGDSNIASEAKLRPLKKFVKRIYIRSVLRSLAGLMPMGSAGIAYIRHYSDHHLPTFLFPYEPDYDAITRRDTVAEEAFRTKHHLDTNRRRILYCGRLAQVKRVDVLIDAFVRVAPKRPEWDLVIAGDGPLRSELEKRVPVALRDRVRWLGFLQTQDTVVCYHNCDLLVLPSEYEPWALVINEAVAAGLAVIATDVVGAAAELVRPGVNGLIVPPGNVDALAAALTEATQPQRLQAMKDAAPAVLKAWRDAADPVDGVRKAMKHFGLI